MVSKRVLHRTMTSSTRCFRHTMLQTSHGLQQRSPVVKLARRSTVAAGNRQRAWRKEMGVEPTGDRMAAPSGFEDQPPHRRRFPSSTFSINDLTATATVLMTPSVHLLSNWSGHAILPEEIKQVASTDSKARNQPLPKSRVPPTHGENQARQIDNQLDADRSTNLDQAQRATLRDLPEPDRRNKRSLNSGPP